MSVSFFLLTFAMYNFIDDDTKSNTLHAFELMRNQVEGLSCMSCNDRKKTLVKYIS